MVRWRSSKGFSIVEYMVMLMILVSSFLLFKDYIIRGITGRWKSASDQIGFSRQYDPTETVVCAFDTEFNQGWYDEICVENKNCAAGNKSCEQQARALCNATAYCQ